MGISIRELLAHDFFREFYVIAGRNGLHKEVQGVAILDAPDGYRWTRGKELVLSSGYVLKQEPDSLQRAFETGSMQQSAGLMLKRERYFEQIPSDIVALFEKYNVPLISMPFSIPYMDVMNHVNTAVMNRMIRRLRILGDKSPLSDFTYREKKIHQILATVESEMKFPAMIYDIGEKKSYYSSDKFPRISAEFHLQDSDYWAPSRPFTKHTLCDYIDMTRYRLMESARGDLPLVSWITIPVVLSDVHQAYFVVMESRELMDYFDEYSIRISYLVLHSVYEQISMAENLGHLAFENYVIMALSEKDADAPDLVYQAKRHNIETSTDYHSALFCRTGPREARQDRKEFERAFRRCFFGKRDKIVFLDENEGMLFFEAAHYKPYNRQTHEGLLTEFQRTVKERLPAMELTIATGKETAPLKEIRSTTEKYRKVMDRGRVMLPGESIRFYEDLGPLVWLDIPARELEHLLTEYRSLMEDPKNIELLRTLKLYLENNLNFSLTAQKQFLHINTVRNRIERLRTLLHTDWEEPVERLKTEILLQFLDL